VNFHVFAAVWIRVNNDFKAACISRNEFSFKLSIWIMLKKLLTEDFNIFSIPSGIAEFNNDFELLFAVTIKWFRRNFLL